MFEIGIFCVILFALGYWATLFIMGRREDVLHGEFVEGEPELIPVPETPPMPFPGVKPVPHPTVVTAEPAPFPVGAVETVAEEAPVVAAPPPKLEPVASAAPPAQRPFIAMPPANTERLQSLLMSIKQELKNASQI